MHIKYCKETSAFLFLLLGGLASGLVNGVFGTGGGIVAVFVFSHIPFFKNVFGTKDIFAMTLTVGFIMSLSSAFTYCLGGIADVKSVIPYIIPAAAGGISGAFLFGKINSCVLRTVFALLTIYAGITLMTR